MVDNDQIDKTSLQLTKHMSKGSDSAESLTEKVLNQKNIAASVKDATASTDDKEITNEEQSRTITQEVIEERDSAETCRHACPE